MKNIVAKPAIACVGFELPTHQLLFDFLSVQFDLISVANTNKLNEAGKDKDLLAVFINLHESTSTSENQLGYAMIQTHTLSVFFIHPVFHRKVYHELVHEGRYYKVIVHEQDYSWSTLHELSDELIRLHQYKKHWTNLLK